MRTLLIGFRVTPKCMHRLVGICCDYIFLFLKFVTRSSLSMDYDMNKSFNFPSISLLILLVSCSKKGHHA